MGENNKKHRESPQAKKKTQITEIPEPKRNLFTGICLFIVNILFAGCITYILTQVFEYGNNGDLNKIGVSVFIALGLAVGIGVSLFAKKHPKGAERNFRLILIEYALITLIIQILPINSLRFTPDWDIGGVFNGAVSWVENGNPNEYEQYFLWYKNNFPLLYIYKVIFGIAKGVNDNPDYFMIAAILGTISVITARVSVAVVCKKVFGVVSAYASMAMMLIFTPLLFMGITFYTDALSLWAFPTCLMFVIFAREKDVMWKKTLFYTLAGITAGLGGKIKATVLILLIALVLTSVIRREWKELLVLGVTNIVSVAVISGIFSGLYYKSFDREKAKIQNTPLIQWIMIGCNGDGSFSGSDCWFSRSFEDTEEREREIKKVIAERYGELGVYGTMRLWQKKTYIDYADATFGIPDFLGYGIEEKNGLQEWVLYSGKNYRKWEITCNGIFLSLLIFMLAGATPWLSRRARKLHETLYSGTKKSEAEFVLTVCFMTFLGIWMFLMLWEANMRYYSNSIGILFIGASAGIPYCYRALRKIPNRIKWIFKNSY